MTLVLLPDVEQIVSAFLRAQPEVVALVADRVFTDLPADKTYPLVRVVRVAGAPSPRWPAWRDEADLQFDCWGGTKRQALVLARTVEAALVQRAPNHVHAGGGVVVDARTSSLAWAPDPDAAATSGSARPRYVLTVSIATHP